MIHPIHVFSLHLLPFENMENKDIITSLKNYKVGGWEYHYDVFNEKTIIEGLPVNIGWIPKGGLALKNVFHNGYSFAKDIRVVCIWVFPNDKSRFEPKPLILGPPDFIQQPITSSKQILAPSNFSSYNTESALEVKWVSARPVFEDAKGKSRNLCVTQSYIFTDYNNEPKHEPAGVLMAARLFPITTINYPDEKDGYIASVRIDYRLHLNLDGSLNHKVNQLFNKIIKNNPKYLGKNFPNQAGVFKDTETHIDAVAGAFLEGGAEGVFNQVEKPLLLEIASIGILDSSPYLDANKSRKGWDNIHWWGYRGEGQPIISAPGASHAVHMHWRWGKNLQTESQFKTAIPSIANQTLTNSASFTIGGPLVDPKIWIQTVRFGIVENIDKFNIKTDNLKNLSKDKYFDLFHINNKPIPRTIENGGDIILFFSVEAKTETIIAESKETIYYPRKINSTEIKILPARKVKASINGKYLIHGLFFGHEPEKESLVRLFTKLGSREPEYSPPRPKVLEEKRWDR